jgi:hypothetical protein
MPSQIFVLILKLKSVAVHLAASGLVSASAKDEGLLFRIASSSSDSPNNAAASLGVLASPPAWSALLMISALVCTRPLLTSRRLGAPVQFVSFVIVIVIVIVIVRTFCLNGIWFFIIVIVIVIFILLRSVFRQ